MANSSVSHDITPTPKARRGFAAMNPDTQREIASRGGLSAHRAGRAHRFTSEEARAASAMRKDRQPPAGS